MAASYGVLKKRTRDDYPFSQEYRTRWADNDQYAHMNNATYIQLFVRSHPSGPPSPSKCRLLTREPPKSYDAIINTYLMQFCGLEPTRSPQHGMVVHSHNDYFVSARFFFSPSSHSQDAELGPDSGQGRRLTLTHARTPAYAYCRPMSREQDSISFPAVAELAMRVNKLGRTSVTYEIALFEKGVDKVRAVGEFVQVFVDRSTGRPCAEGLSRVLRDGLERILVKTDDEQRAPPIVTATAAQPKGKL